MAVKKTQNDGYAQLRADMAAGTLAPAYLFHGEESYLREFCLSEIRRQLVPEGFEAFNFHRLEGKGLTAQALTEAVEAMPMMAERTLTAVTDWDLFKLGRTSGKSSSPCWRTCRHTAASSSSTTPWNTSSTRP